MDTNITYLQKLGEDLDATAARESIARARATVAREPAPSGSRIRRGGRDHAPRWVRLTAATAALLTVAGGIGFVATGGLSGGGARYSVAASPAVGPASQADPQFGRPETLPAPLPAGGGSLASDQARGQYRASDEAVSSDAQAGGVSSSGGGIPEISKVIKTADLSIVVARDSFQDRFQAATDLAGRLGGFVQSSSQNPRSGHLLMRVPAKSFDAARRELKALGIRVERESIQGLDVTTEFVDLKARLEILQARREALLKLLHDATSLDAILRLTNEVDDVLTRIEELKGQIRLINDQTSKATISLAMREEGVEPTPVVDKPSLGSALAHGVAGFLSVLYAVVVGLGYLIPIAAIAGVAWLIARTARRREGQAGGSEA